MYIVFYDKNEEIIALSTTEIMMTRLSILLRDIEYTKHWFAQEVQTHLKAIGYKIVDENNFLSNDYSI